MKRSAPIIKRTVVSLDALLGDAQERGTLIRNAVHELSGKKRGRTKSYDMGNTKSSASFRSIPIPPIALNTRREWKLQCPGSRLDVVFPTGKGSMESHSNVVHRGLQAAQIAAGITVDTGEKDRNGEPILKAKYTGLHSLRHWFASWCINRKVDGGLELTPKLVQQRMGHSSIAQTMDTYGHLFPELDEGESLRIA